MVVAAEVGGEGLAEVVMVLEEGEFQEGSGPLAHQNAGPTWVDEDFTMWDTTATARLGGGRQVTAAVSTKFTLCCCRVCCGQGQAHYYSQYRKTVEFYIYNQQIGDRLLFLGKIPMNATF